MELEPGIYHDLPFEDYKALPYVNSSAIKAGIKSESLKKMRHLIEEDCEDKDSREKKFGRAQHAYILEGEEAFFDRFLVATTCCAITGKGSPCSNPGKLYDGHSWFCGVKGHAPEGASEPADYVLQEEIDSIKHIRRSLESSPCVTTLKTKGWAETTLVWDHDGMRCKARVDRFSESPPIIIDLKKFDRKELTVRNCADEIAGRLYHVQAAFYRMAVEALTGKRAAFMWIFTESGGPWDVLPVQVTANDMYQGLLLCKAWLARYAAAKDSGHFPGVWELNKPAQVELPDWVHRKYSTEDVHDDGASNDNGAEVPAAGTDGYEPTDEDGDWLG
jgi:hypothetical protein